MDIQLPETKHRQHLLHATLKWIGMFYQGEGHQEAGDRAIRAVLGLPAAPADFAREHFTRARFDTVMHAFGELTHMALFHDRHGVLDDAELVLASEVYADVPDGTDWLHDESLTCRVMVSMVLAWCMRSGLDQAMTDIDGLDGVDFDNLLT